MTHTLKFLVFFVELLNLKFRITVTSFIYKNTMLSYIKCRSKGRKGKTHSTLQTLTISLHTTLPDFRETVQETGTGQGNLFNLNQNGLEHPLSGESLAYF